MPPRQRQSPLAALVVLVPVLLVVLLVGVWLGGHPDYIPSFMRGTFVKGNETRVVGTALDRISSDYYRPVGSAQLTDASIAGAVASLHDRFSHYLSPSEFKGFNAPASFSGIGVSVRGVSVNGPGVPGPPRGLGIVQVFDSSPAQEAGLRVGDVIVSVDGRSLAGLSEGFDTTLIRGRPGTDVRLGVESPGSTHEAHGAHGARGGHGPHGAHGAHGRVREVRVTRETISEPVVASATRVVHGVRLGMVALAAFSEGAHGEVIRAVEKVLHEGARGIVLDLRGNGGGLVKEAQLIASLFLPEGAPIVTTRGRAQPTQTIRAVGGQIPPGIPMVVLVDGNTASSAEIVTAALQDHRRAGVVGVRTFGKGVFQEEEPLSNGGALDITVGEYFTPDGRNLGGGGIKQGAGITPEVRVRRGVDTLEGLGVALGTLAARVRGRR
ncbi:MAG TPA: S41 family peptidase [Solirubrobacteraceae bacterium]|nr:S41 family peptidase [Solirubrobacteraceae bacterium]